MKRPWIRPAVAGVALALTACGDGVDQAELVARVDDHTLTVDQVVDLLVDEEALAADAAVVRTLSDFWVDYTLLAEAVRRDTTLSQLDLEPLVEQQLWQEMVFALRDSVIQVDTFITESELEALYDEEEPELELRARHIMFTYPVQATAAQRDSVRAALEAVRDRIEGGASFEVLARQLSQDRGTAAAGGDLGYFSRGEMVAPFEEAALALGTGEVSEVVRTPMGLHLIRVDDRRVRGFDEAAGAFRARIQQERVQRAESTFVAAIEARVEPTVVDGAASLTREIAETVDARLSRGAAQRPLMEWDGGEVTVGELQTLLRVESPGLRQQLAEAPDDRIETFLGDLARRELLIGEARSAGLAPSGERVDSLVAEAAGQLRQAARVLGFMELDQAPGEPVELAIARAVEEALQENLAGATRFVPLGLVSFQLRDRASYAMYEAGIGQAIVRIGQVRAARLLPPSQEGVDPSVADTTGR